MLVIIFPCVGAWRSLVAHLNGVQGVGSSNLLAPTINTKGLRKFRKPFFMPKFCGVQIGVQGMKVIETRKITLATMHIAGEAVGKPI